MARNDTVTLSAAYVTKLVLLIQALDDEYHFDNPLISWELQMIVNEINRRGTAE